MRPISQTKLLGMIKKNQIDPSHFASRRISKTQVIIEVKNKKRFDVINAPKTFPNDGTVETILTFFTLPEYCEHIQLGEKVKRNIAVKSFFNFISRNETNWRKGNGSPDSSVKNLPINCPQEWFAHLQQTETEKICWAKMTSITRILDCTLRKIYGKLNAWPTAQRRIYDEFKALTPKVPKNEKLPPIGKYLGIPESEFTNRELLMGLRYGAIWTLMKLQSQRKKFLSKSEISNIFENFKGCTVEKFHDTFSKRNKFSYIHNFLEANSKIFSTLHKPSWITITEDPLLREWQCYTWKEFGNILDPASPKELRPLSAEFQLEFLSGFTQSGDALSLYRDINDVSPEWNDLHNPFKQRVSITRPCRWGLDWYVHTDIEILLMSWLLATERAQTSGIMNLTFDDIYLSDSRPRTLQISTTKLRRTSNTKKVTSRVESIIYRQSDPPFIVYQNWLEREKLVHNHLLNYNSNKKFMYGPERRICGTLITARTKSFSPRLTPLELISVPGTVWHSTFLNETPSTGMREAKAFIAILKNRIQKKISNPNASVTLPIFTIGQSVVLEQQRSTNQRSPFSSVESETLGHSEDTGRNIYKKGFCEIGIEELLEPVRAFARRVGDDKIKLAYDIAQRLEQSQRQVTLGELESICGIETSTHTQQQLLNHLDEKDMLTVSGEIINGDEVLIIETESTACLMWAYIRHIEKSIVSLLSSPRSTQSIQYLAKLINLHHIFDGLPKHLQMTGKSLSDGIDFKFPPLE